MLLYDIDVFIINVCCRSRRERKITREKYGNKIYNNVERRTSTLCVCNDISSPRDITVFCAKSHFARYAESIPEGETSAALSEAARKNNVYVIGGTIPERSNEKLYNTCTVWGPDGKLVAKHRKMHLFDIDIKEKITFRESDSLSAGNSLTIFEAKGCKIGIGICYDIRFEEMARLYRNKGCQMLIYPAAFNMTTGPLHWSLLQRARANDNQLYVACVSPARGSPPGYVAWGHTQLTNPWGEILEELDAVEDMVISDIDLKVVDEVRAQIPTSIQRRTDLYDTIWKKEN